MPDSTERKPQYEVETGPVNRLWCNACDKAVTLPNLAPETLQEYERQHRCGPRTSPWDSHGRF